MKKPGYVLYCLIIALLFTLSTATVIVCGCTDDQSVNQKELTVRDKQNVPDLGKVKVVTHDGVIFTCDSTWDKQVENYPGYWVKIAWRNGEVVLEYPYDWNPKGFTTK